VRIESLDHLVLTVRDVEATIDFYAHMLGASRVSFGEGRLAVAFGVQRIHLHPAGAELEPKAAQPTPGSADLCFLTPTPMEQVVGELHSEHVQVVEGPVERQGAAGTLLSVYVRDPDGNLVEISNVL
jgi:catechol 2,3-dioxygenase-like lactoylglutathione lyase family enzyme